MKTSYCSIHNTYPSDDEPCWGCVNQFVHPLTKACESALCWLENAPIDYSNGVVHQGIDEGNVRGWEGHSDIVDELRNALGIKVDKRGLPLANDSEGDILF